MSRTSIRPIQKSTYTIICFTLARSSKIESPICSDNKFVEFNSWSHLHKQRSLWMMKRLLWWKTLKGQNLLTKSKKAMEYVWQQIGWGRWSIIVMTTYLLQFPRLKMAVKMPNAEQNEQKDNKYAGSFPWAGPALCKTLRLGPVTMPSLLGQQSWNLRLNWRKYVPNR